MDHALVARVVADMGILTGQLADYAADSERAEADSGEVRRVRVVASSLLAACDAIARMPPPMPMPMMLAPAPAPMPAPPPAAAPAAQPPRR